MRLVLPPSIPAVVGIECNLYFDNVVLVARSGNVMFDAVCAEGTSTRGTMDVGAD